MLDRTTAPQHRIPEFKPFPLPLKYQLSGGTNIFSFNQGDQDVFQIELIFPVGSSVANNPAIPALCFEMLREGSTTMTVAEINHKLDYFGAFLNLKPGIDNSFITLYGRSEFLADLVPLLAEIVFNPLFSEQALLKQKKKLVQELLIKQKKTSYWAPRLLRKKIFGDGHPYSKIIAVEDINKVNRADLISFHQKYLLPGLQNIIMAGSFDENLVNSLLLNYFNSDFTSRPHQERSIVKASLSSPISKLLDNTTQASIAVGKVAPRITSDVYPTYAFLSKILGGYFGSRLMRKLREEEGITYGIYAYPTHLRGGSYLQITADVSLKEVDKSIDLIMSEINKLKNEEVPVAEINTVKNYMLGEFANNTNTVFDFADLYKKILTQSLKENYYESFFSKVSAITSNELYSMASEIFDTGQFIAVKVK